MVFCLWYFQRKCKIVWRVPNSMKGEYSQFFFQWIFCTLICFNSWQYFFHTWSCKIGIFAVRDRHTHMIFSDVINKRQPHKVILKGTWRHPVGNHTELQMILFYTGVRKYQCVLIVTVCSNNEHSFIFKVLCRANHN